MSTQSSPGWRTKGTLLQGRNCDYGCPCNFNAPPTHGTCDGTWIGHIDQGNYGDAGLDGLNFAIGAHWPAAIHLGNGEAFILIDERGDQAQRVGLLAVLTGQVGGPLGILVNTISKLHEPQYLPFDLKLDGANSSVRVGDAVELEMEPILNPVTGAEAYPGVVLPQGLLYSESTRASTKT